MVFLKKLNKLEEKNKQRKEKLETDMKYENMLMECRIKFMPNGKRVGQVHSDTFRKWERTIKISVAIAKIREGLSNLKNLNVKV